jgi:hypothetical protein
VAANAISLVQAGNRMAATLARQHEWAADDQAFMALVDAGRALLPALEEVVADADFWSRLSNAAAGSALLTDEERETLGRFSDADLTAMLEALRYAPPPPVETFVEDTMDAVSGVLEVDLSADVRAARVRQLEFELSSFVWRLRRLLDVRRDVTPAPARRRLRSVLRRGSKIALSLGVAALGIVTEAGFVAHGFDPNVAKFFGKTGEVLATAAATQVENLLPEERAAEVEMAVKLDEIDPTARIKVFLRLLESTLASAATSEEVTDETLDRIEVHLTRLRRAEERTGRRSNELNHALEGIAGSLYLARLGLALPAAMDFARQNLTDALDYCRRAREIIELGSPGSPVDVAARAAARKQEPTIEEKRLEQEQAIERLRANLAAHEAEERRAREQLATEERAAEERAAEERAGEERAAEERAALQQAAQQQQRRYMQR